MIEQIIRNGIIKIQEIPALKAELEQNETRLIFMDSTFILPDSDENIAENFKNSHIFEAMLFNISEICDKSSSLPHMLPPEELFDHHMSDIGIQNDDFIILYGQSGAIMGPARVWWMLKGFGHKNIAVLDGGLPHWLKGGHPVQKGYAKKWKKTDYHCTPFDRKMIVDMNEMIDISMNEKHTILDARPKTRFDGTSPEPREDMRSGHIPNSLSCPCSLLVNESGLFKDKNELERLFETQGLTQNKDERIITTCGSGITACALALALYQIGYTNVSVYDGSWSEWGSTESPTKISTNQ